MSVDSVSQSGSSVESAYKAGRAVIAARRHCVSTGHYLATQAAFQILEAGGNAIDAGVAAGLVLGVVHSDQVNIAGVAPMIIYLANRREVVTIDGLGVWPAAASLEHIRKAHGGEIPEGLLRTVVPAAPAAFIKALGDFGTLSFGTVASFALRFAREGFLMYPFMHEQLQMVKHKLERWPSNRDIYLPGGDVPAVGALFVQSDLAGSIQYLIDEEHAALARGGSRLAGLQAARDAFYKGDIAQKITGYHAAHGGWLTPEDMANFEVKFERPVVTRYHDLEIHACGFWCQGPTLGQALNLLKGFDLKQMGHNTPAYIHHVAEALKLVFADREAFYGDPRFNDTPADWLLSDRYADERRKLIREDRAWPGLPPSGANTRPAASGDPGGQAGGPFDTSCVTVVDHAGNAICIAPSDVCSDTPVIPGTGLAPSSRGSQSWALSGHASCLAPGKRPRLTPSPALVMRPGKMVMPIGSPGGDSQTQANIQVLLNMEVFGMDPQTAIEAPRFITYSHPDSFSPHKAFPGRLCLEGRIAQATAQALSDLGHEVVIWPDRLWRAGGVCTVRHDLERGVYEAGADPRRAASSALGW
ncbi:gamma-glutamyltransferase family protein [Cupriavidus basilensis]|uniref:gamma-glutamyltransferase family protein n=1 Tax=Cupriavidus basilensis TaxID=68895 RepID=UPI0007513072|nr:gamma-glutamyltransferase [Cupriavidus basilensis]